MLSWMLSAAGVGSGVGMGAAGRGVGCSEAVSSAPPGVDRSRHLLMHERRVKTTQHKISARFWGAAMLDSPRTIHSH